MTKISVAAFTAWCGPSSDRVRGCVRIPRTGKDMILRRVSQLFLTMDTLTVTLRTLNGRLAAHTSRMLLLNAETERDSCGNALSNPVSCLLVWGRSAGSGIQISREYASPSRLTGNKILGSRQRESAREPAASEGLITVEKSLVFLSCSLTIPPGARANIGAETHASRGLTSVSCR
jgi:hypothetical protein